MLTLRIRSVMWFTIGIALSVILVWSFTAWRASAAPGANESTFVPVTPTRILDTRDPTNVGLVGPFVSAVSQDLQITGNIPTTTGPQLVVPAGATGVVLNTTVINSTENGFLSLRNADALGLPTTSSINFLAGQVLANAVEVPLPTAGVDAGKIEITYDAYGTAGPTTDVIIDIVGFFTSQGLQELVADVAALQAQLDASARAVFSGGNQFVALTATPFVARDLTFTPPSDGTVIVTSSAGGVAEPQDAVNCSITQGTAVDPNFNQIFEGSTTFDRGMLSGVRGYDVTGGVPFTVRLVCEAGTGTPDLFDSNLTATFTASDTLGSMSVADAGDAGSPELGEG